MIWLTGQPGSGKTTLANMLLQKLNNPKYINIDGDNIRTLFNNYDYSKQGRTKNIINVIALAEFLINNNLIPIISVVAPYRSLREAFKKKYNILEVYCHTTKDRNKTQYYVKEYEPPLTNYLDMDTTIKTIRDCVNEILVIYRQMATLA